MAVWICIAIPSLISSISIYYVTKSDIRPKSYDHLNFSRASDVQFQASRYILSLNQTSESKVMAIWIFHALQFLISSILICYAPWAFMFHFKRLNILCAWIGHTSEKLWPFEFLESFQCSISSVSIYYWPESDIWVKSHCHLNLPYASMFNFKHLNILCT